MLRGGTVAFRLLAGRTGRARHGFARGEYPLQIGGVSITAEVSEQPWTRMTESTDGQSSVWTGGEQIGVRIGDSEETGIYQINVDDAGNVTVTPITPVYWTNTQPATVTAWYPATDGTVYLNSQDDNGLAYVLRGTTTGAPQTPVTLSLTHQLAKVRVITRGTADVSGFEVFAPYNCYVEEGEIISAPSSPTDRIPMRQSAYEDIGTCWEANAAPGELPRYEVHCRNGYSGVYDLPSPMTLETGKLHTITLTLNRKGTIDLSQRTETYTIATDGDYYFNGTGSYGIRVTGGNPTIYLGDAHISVTSGNAIHIEGGNATIHLLGENSVTSSNGAGIYVAEGSSVTIQGRDRNDVLTARAGNNGAGIGGYGVDAMNCGNITIRNVKVDAYGAENSVSYPGIGGHESCETITIDNATVYARGTGSSMDGSPAIGSYASVPTIVISGSNIYACRGANANGTSYADWIGRGGDVIEYASGAIQGTITSTTVYKGKWDKNSGRATDEGTVAYDASGNATQQ